MPDKLYQILHNLGAAAYQVYLAESPSLQSTCFSSGDLEENFPLGDFRTSCCIFDCKSIGGPHSQHLGEETWALFRGLHGCREGRRGCRHLLCIPSWGK